jgi:hypothetical protein
MRTDARSNVVNDSITRSLIFDTPLKSRRIAESQGRVGDLKAATVVRPTR